MMLKTLRLTVTYVPKRFYAVNFNIEDEPKNEPILNYHKESKERIDLEKALAKYQKEFVDIPIVIGDKEYRTQNVKYQLFPHDHKHKLAKFYYATPDLINKAIETSLKAQEAWDNTPFDERAQIFARAADMVSNKERMNLMASTMLGQAKTVIQAEIDTACELADFLRFNNYFGKKLQKYQPYSPPGVRNSYRFRGLEGFIAAISPFNFTAIGGNLASSTALMGNVVLWKPSDTAILSNYLTYKIFRECGLPPGVINFIPCDGPEFSDCIMASPALAGINFTGSVATFRNIWLRVSQNLAMIGNWPRLVGECGGKNYHLVHPSADMNSVLHNTIRGTFEYGGQKCSACSILYVPKSVWPALKESLVSAVKTIKIGDPTENKTFFSAVIDKRAFDKISSYIQYAKSSPDYQILAGGKCDDKKGYFIEPTVIETTNPKGKLMSEEIFGPVLTVYAYNDNDFPSVLKLIKESIYGLTGSIFAKDKHIIDLVTKELRQVNGNFYINDKCTGSIVNQQPFGGARASGTNDKAGGPHYLLKWASPQSIKESTTPLTEWKYKYMTE